MVFLHLTAMNQPYLESGEESQSYVLMIQLNQLIIMNGPNIISNLQVHLNYLFIDTYNAATLIWVTINFYINRKVVFYFQFSIMDLCRIWTAEPWIHSHPLSALPSELSVIE